MPRVLLINGASGTGKTATASVLADKIEEAVWIHPDALWDTTSLTSESILEHVVRRLYSIAVPTIAIVDCQVRASAARDIFSQSPVFGVVHVLLTCPRRLREDRLISRGSHDADFDRIETWAGVLLAEALDAGDLVVDTSVESTPATCMRIIEHLGIGATPGDA